MHLDSAALPAVQQQIQSLALPEYFLETVECWYLPLAQQIANLKSDHSDTLLVSFNGSQGSGKSTMTAFLCLILKNQFKLNTLEVSIDDFYLTRAGRQALAEQVHPLLLTRGVPGTHDVALAQQTFDCLRHCSGDNPCQVPSFDKAIDDRKPQNEWNKVEKKVDVILFEGWCNHAPVQSSRQLEQPINTLERDEDIHAIWRTYVNDQLRQYHESLFNLADYLVFLQAPSFEKVYEWRGLQESKLADQVDKSKPGIMNTAQLKRFIQHYERITRSCMDELPKIADVIVRLDDAHQIVSMETKSEEPSHV